MEIKWNSKWNTFYLTHSLKWYAIKGTPKSPSGLSGLISEWQSNSDKKRVKTMKNSTSTNEQGFTSRGSRREVILDAKKTYSRGERCKQIADAIYQERRLYGRSMTMRQIAKAIGLKPSAYVMDLIWSCVEDGRINAEPSDYRPGWIVWHFGAHEGFYAGYLRRLEMAQDKAARHAMV